MSYIDELLATLKTIFVRLFEPFLATFITSLHAASKGVALTNSGETAATWNFAKTFENWDAVFNKILHGLESKAAQVRSLYPYCAFQHLTYFLKDRKARFKPAQMVLEPSPSSDDMSTSKSTFPFSVTRFVRLRGNLTYSPFPVR